MPQVNHSHKGKHSHHFKRTTCIGKQLKDHKTRPKTEKKECLSKNGKFNVIFEDMRTVNRPNIKVIQKRKLLNDNDYEWDWAPYPRRLKTQHDDDSTLENSDYLSDGLDDSHVVPNWEDNEQGTSNDLLFCVPDEASVPKSADIHVVAIDEVIEFDSSKSPTGHLFEEEPICFDIEQICEIVGTEDNEKNLTIDKQENALDVLVAFTNNNPRMIIYEESPTKLKGVKQMEPHRNLFDCNESSEDVVKDQWENDCRVEEFKFARCFKCRRKVYVMQDCPRHLMKGKIIQIK